MSESEKVKCRCGLDAALKVASSGRKYFGCPRRAASGHQCEFTRMLPSVAQEGSLHASVPHSSGQSTTLLKESDPHELPPLTSTPVKRVLPSMDRDVGDETLTLSPSQKRAKIVDAALKGQDSIAIESNLSSSQKRTKIIEEALAASSHHACMKSIAPGFSLPSPNPSDDLPFADVNQSEHRAGNAGAPLTQRTNSSQTILPSDDGDSNFVSQPSGFSNFEGKVQWIPQTPKRSNNNLSANTLINGSSSPSSSDKHEDIASAPSTTQRQYSATFISRTLDDLAGLPDYVHSLEKGHEIKDMKIKYLENDIQRLKDRQAELEKLLILYERSPISQPNNDSTTSQ